MTPDAGREKFYMVSAPFIAELHPLEVMSPTARTRNIFVEVSSLNKELDVEIYIFITKKLVGLI